MTIPSSGALAYTTVQTEFGGSNPISDSEYYAGGAYVPSGTTGTNGAVPSSGTLAWSKFYGTSRGFSFAPTISGDNWNYNIGSRASIAGWNGVIPLFAAITIDGTGYVGSVDNVTPSFTVGSLPTGSTVIIYNSGWILGKGGDGNSYDGGPALSVSYATTLYNYNTIGGGGGGGSLGAPNGSSGGAGGGGAGFDVGLAGADGYYSGENGGRLVGGSAGGGEEGFGGPGGTGGDIGLPGQAKLNPGGLAGYCISGNGYISYGAFGNRFGSVS